MVEGLALLLWDVAAAFLIFAASARTADLLGARAAEPFGSFDDPALLGVALSVLALLFSGHYDHRRSYRAAPLLNAGRLLVIGGLVAWTVAVASDLAGAPADLSQLLMASVALPAVWFTGRWAIDGRLIGGTERVLVIGTGAVAARLVQLASRHSNLGYEVTGFLDDDPLPLPDGHPPVLGSLDDLDWVLHEGAIDRVIVAFSPRSDADILRILRDCDRRGVDVDVVPRLFDLMGAAPKRQSIGGLALLGIQGRRHSVAQQLLKRSVDIVVSGTMLLLLSPLMAVIAAAVRLDDGGSVFFRQLRVGRDGEPFRVLKFRTMAEGPEVGAPDITSRMVDGSDDINADIERLVEAVKGQNLDRVTAVGRLLRKASLDELPQLWNVLNGQMSLVGPRPLRPFEVAALEEWQAVRQEVRPGITGLWQVLGRSEVSWHERMQLDYDYVRHWSVMSDIKILLKTIPAVISRTGAR